MITTKETPAAAISRKAGERSYWLRLTAQMATIGVSPMTEFEILWHVVPKVVLIAAPLLPQPRC
jgi:predicted cobalt transporter CbtA